MSLMGHPPIWSGTPVYFVITMPFKRMPTEIPLLAIRLVCDWLVRNGSHTPDSRALNPDAAYVNSCGRS